MTITTLELPPVVLVGLEVAGDDDAVGELPAGEGVLRLLAVGDGLELHEDLATAGNLKELNLIPHTTVIVGH